MSSGETLTSFAAYLCVSRQTLYNWAEAHQEFLDAIKRAKIKAQKHWEGLLLKSANEGNITAIIFTMKTRFGYQEKELAKLLDVPEESFDTEYGELKSNYESTR